MKGHLSLKLFHLTLMCRCTVVCLTRTSIRHRWCVRAHHFCLLQVSILLPRSHAYLNGSPPTSTLLVCAISSKFYTARPELHPRLTSLAKSLAFSVPEKGYKSVEIVQAYLLLTLWGCGPVERYEHDKTWLLLGMGIRLVIVDSYYYPTLMIPNVIPCQNRYGLELT